MRVGDPDFFSFLRQEALLLLRAIFRLFHAMKDVGIGSKQNSAINFGTPPHPQPPNVRVFRKKGFFNIYILAQTS